MCLLIMDGVVYAVISMKAEIVRLALLDDSNLRSRLSPNVKDASRRLVKRAKGDTQVTASYRRKECPLQAVPSKLQRPLPEHE